MEARLSEVSEELAAALAEREGLEADKAALAESLRQEKSTITQERKSLEEKCTFLHFTQEQLNSQVGNHICYSSLLLSVSACLEDLCNSRKICLDYFAHSQEIASKGTNFGQFQGHVP